MSGYQPPFVEYIQLNRPLLDSGINYLCSKSVKFIYHDVFCQFSSKGVKKVTIGNVGSNFLNIRIFLTYNSLNRCLIPIVTPVPGILARDSHTVATVTKLLLENNHLQMCGDPDLLPIPWNEQVWWCRLSPSEVLNRYAFHFQAFIGNKKLRIGYYEDDGFFPTTPGIRRAIQIAKTALEASGHDLVPFVPPRVDYVLNSFISILTADQSRYLLQAL